jgi:CRISPR-associated protein Csd2
VSDRHIDRITGLVVLEVVDSNPNGDPDREGEPRQWHDNRGLISPVSFKRKLRDLVECKDGPVWEHLRKALEIEADKYAILESRGRNRSKISAEMIDGSFGSKYWDARVFGNTFLEEKGQSAVKAGVVNFGMGLSVAPIEIARMTLTNKAGVEADKDRGMAPLGYRVVRHGVYCMPFFVNPSQAVKTGCTAKDIELLLRLVPHAYDHTRSFVRPNVVIRHAWVVRHNHPLGSCPDYLIVEALKPRKQGDPDVASLSWADYADPASLGDPLLGRVKSCRDLVQEAFV